MMLGNPTSHTTVRLATVLLATAQKATTHQATTPPATIQQQASIQKPTKLTPTVHPAVMSKLFLKNSF
jgi:uncharacterized lipoprotein YajG